MSKIWNFQEKVEYNYLGNSVSARICDIIPRQMQMLQIRAYHSLRNRFTALTPDVISSQI